MNGEETDSYAVVTLFLFLVWQLEYTSALCLLQILPIFTTNDSLVSIILVLICVGFVFWTVHFYN